MNSAINLSFYQSTLHCDLFLAKQVYTKSQSKYSLARFSSFQTVDLLKALKSLKIFLLLLKYTLSFNTRSVAWALKNKNGCFLSNIVALKLGDKSFFELIKRLCLKYTTFYKCQYLIQTYDRIPTFPSITDRMRKRTRALLEADTRDKAPTMTKRKRGVFLMCILDKAFGESDRRKLKTYKLNNLFASQIYFLFNFLFFTRVSTGSDTGAYNLSSELVEFKKIIFFLILLGMTNQNMVSPLGRLSYSPGMTIYGREKEDIFFGE